MSVDQQVSPTHAAFRQVFGEATDLVERLFGEDQDDRAVGLATVLALLHAEAFEWGVPSDDGFAQLIRDMRCAMSEAVRP